MNAAGAAPGFEPSPGYLRDVEATHLGLQALPGALMVYLVRNFASEKAQGAQHRAMFVELSLGEAMAFHALTGDMIRAAIALEHKSGTKDSAPSR